MAEKVREEVETTYETEHRRDSTTGATTIHKRKVTTTTTYYDDGSSRVTNVERGDWYSTGVP
jgi:hypothetical protein